MLGRDQTPRQTIAVLIDYLSFLDGGYESELRRALIDRIEALDLDLVLAFGGAIGDPSTAGHDRIFELVASGPVDGVILLSTCLAAHAGADGVARFAERLRRDRPLPMSSIGAALPGIPSVLVDNRPGMAAVVEHLILRHGKRRLAFLGGTPANPEAEERLAVYQEVLDRHGLPYDPALVEPGYFVSRSGAAAMDTILRRGVPFDAVVAANDSMAFGAMTTLREHGRRIPDDVPVTGFDDLVLARLSSPALTTVAQPFARLAEAAIDLVRGQLLGRSVPLVTRVPVRLVERQSCGCASRVVHDDTATRAAAGGTSAAYLRDRTPEIREQVARHLPDGSTDGARVTDRLIEQVAPVLDAPEERGRAFLGAVEDLIAAATPEGEELAILGAAIGALRRELRPCCTPALEDLWHAARDRIESARRSREVARHFALNEAYVRWLVLGDRISASYDLATLKAALLESLPEVRVRTLCVSRQVAGSPDELEPYVCLVEGALPAAPLARFRASRLVPPGFDLGDGRHTLLAFPLVFDQRLLGVVIFEDAPHLDNGQMLARQISAALGNVELYDRVLAETRARERSVQERVATAQRLEALSVLAGGVAHDLNNALGPLVALPDLMLTTLEDLGCSPATAPTLHEDIAAIKAASLRASQTIKDLLTLGRQGKTAREALDLVRTVASCLNGEPLRHLRTRHPALELVLELPTEPVIIRASEAQLMRAVTNLLRNACDALVDGRGTVKVRVSRVHLAEPQTGYETIAEGNYAVLTVEDQGSGIRPEDLERVFEPFFTRKRTNDESGSGLGLSIVYGVIKEHEGFVDVSSEIGAGTRFTLYFPSVDRLPRARSSRPPPPALRARILVVDDEPVQLRTCRRLLLHLGHEVEVMPSGAQAIEAFEAAARDRRQPYDLVILDMLLGEERDGLEVFEQLRRHCPEQRAILASGYSTVERAAAAVQDGLTWLAKPYTLDGLGRAVTRALLDHSSSAPPAAGNDPLPVGNPDDKI